MTALGNYNHDFPRLAKQSGYYFQLYRGRVNWTEIENVNIDEIIENRNFQLLEQNLLNVVNCNLDREYDLKILDQKFVKLFKLAQLGVDYLSYCEMYLDRCVILLQEQLVAFQEELEILKQEIDKKNEEIKKIKKKSRIQSYQCDKCDKAFISDVYLKFHDKRRHSNPTTPKSLDRSIKICTDTFQQTENERKQTTFTQTQNNETKEVNTQDSEEIVKIKDENKKKIENLEKELEDLKTRLNKAENTLTEKTEASNSNPQISLNYPGPIFYPPMLPFLPPYLPQTRGGCYDINPGYQLLVPEYRQQFSPTPPDTHLATTVNAEVVKATPELEKSIRGKERQHKYDIFKETESESYENSISSEKLQKNKKTKIPEKMSFDKENVDPKAQKETLPVKPLPFPRKIRKAFQDADTVEPFIIPEIVLPESDPVPFNSKSITSSSTPIKEKPEVETRSNFSENVEEVSLNKKGIVSIESLNSQEIIPTRNRSQSFIKKIVSKNSPKLQELSNNFKRSLTNLYDSVSSSGKDFVKTRDCKTETSNKKETIVGLNEQLRHMGVDPDWSGIPKKTMKQKLKDLKHRRNLLTKENPMYPAIRKSIERKIFKKISKNSFHFGGKKGVSNTETNQQESIEPEPREVSPNMQNTQKPTVKSGSEEGVFKKSVMYNIDSDSESEISDLECPEKLNEPHQILSEKTESNEIETVVERNTSAEKEFDISIFQVDKAQPKDLVKSNLKKDVITDELQTDSDFDDDFLEEFESETFKTLTGFSEYKPKTEDEKFGKNEINGSRVISEFLEPGRDKVGNKEALKSSQTKPQLVHKKKVLFAENLDNDYESWSLKSDWGIEEG